MKGSVVLFSGGIDSTVCLHLAKKKGPCIALGFNYGQSSVVELIYARTMAEELGVPFHVAELEIPGFRHFNMTFSKMVWARNALFLSYAATNALNLGYGSVVLGLNRDDWGSWSDCSPSFIVQMRKALQSGYHLKLETPLMRKSKKEVISLANYLGIDLKKTWTCSDPKMFNTPCGVCESCKLLT